MGSRYDADRLAGAEAKERGDPIGSNPHRDDWTSGFRWSAWRSGFNASPFERRRLLASGLTAADLTPAVLQQIADGGIMEPGALYLPAGRCSLDEVRARNA